jgi:hypothetical protein
MSSVSHFVLFLLPLGTDYSFPHIYLVRSPCIPQVVSLLLPTTASRVRAQVISCGICGGQNDTGAGFLRILRLFLPIIIPSIAPDALSSSGAVYKIMADVPRETKKELDNIFIITSVLKICVD